MDPFSGELLALANYPTFNPNASSRTRTLPKEPRGAGRLRAWVDGQSRTAGAALEENSFDTDLINTSPGVIRLAHESSTKPKDTTTER
jgi:cell division protein FtsI/penicillin-binding protein 2